MKSKLKNLQPSLLYISLFLLLLLFLTGSCRKAPINGDLDGQWQIQYIEEKVEKEGGGYEIVRTDSDLQHFYCFYLHVVQLTGQYGFTGNMHYEDNKIALDFPYASDGNLSQLRTYGITSNPIVLTVEKVDKKDLIMKNGDITIVCRRF